MEENFIENYINYASEFTDAPIIFHKFCAYSALAAAIGNKIYFEFGDMLIHPNLWIIILAPSSLYRKSTSVGIARRLLHSAELNVTLPNEFTHEGLIEVLAAQPQGIFMFDEFMSLAMALEKDYMLGAKAFLTHLFDSPRRYHRNTKAGSYVIEKPCISILAATTIDWFLERIKERDLYGGFLTRFIFVPYSAKKDRIISFAPPANPDKRQALAFQLEQLSRTESIIKFDSEAIAVHDEWYENNCVKNAEKLNGLIGSFMNRLQMYLLKLALLEQIAVSYNPGLTHVGKEAMKRAVISVDFLKNNLQRLCMEELTFDRYQERRKKILVMVEEKKETGISKSELLTMTRIPVKELNEIIGSLIEEEKVREIHDQTDAGLGRKKTKYYSVTVQL